MQRFAIYGRVKAFVLRKELSAWIESFMLEINMAYKSFSVSRPPRIFLSFVVRLQVQSRRTADPEAMVIDLLCGRRPSTKTLKKLNGYQHTSKRSSVTRKMFGRCGSNYEQR
jgi:hypothetical protein